MLKRFAACVFVVACSSNAAPPPSEPISIATQHVASFQSDVEPARDAVAAWTLTASDGSGLRLVGVEARAVIEGPLAFTELHLRFENPEARVREGTFAITMPAGAAISRFAMEESGVLKEAEVVPKALARRAYDDFLHRGIDPALLEKAPGNQFTARVFPIPANSEKHLVLSYSQELTNTGYMLPLRGLPKIDKVSIELAVAGRDGKRAKQTLVEHAWQPDRDFVAELTSTAAVRDGTLVAGVFEIVPTFSEVAQDANPTDHPSAITLLVDTSASRALGYTRYLETVRTLVASLAARYAGLQVEVIAFDQTTQVIYAGPAGAFGDREIAALVARGPAGASDLAKAAARAKGRTVIVTDGVVTAGLEGVLLAKAFGKADRVDVVLAGGIREERVARAVTRAGKRAGDVFDADREALATISRGLGERVRVDVPVEVANATSVYPKLIPSLRNGTQVMVYARLKAPADAFEVTIGGTRYTAPTGRATPALLARAAARVEIEALEVELAATPASDVKTATRLRADIERRSVAHRVVSSQTTMLVLDTEQDYATYGIDRRSLADILVVGRAGLEQTKQRTFVATRTRGGNGEPRLSRQQAIEAARDAGILGTTAPMQGGFASLTATADLSTGFDDSNVYGGLMSDKPPTGSGFGAGRGAIRRRVAAAPAVQIAMPVVSGSLDRTIIKRYIKRRINQISYCYERELIAKPTLEGTVTTRFAIEKGRVTSVTASGVDETVATCVADVIKTIEFPTVIDDGVTVINYPFNFRLAGSTHEAAPLPDAAVVVAPLPPPPPPPPPPPIGTAPIHALDGKLKVVMRLLAKQDKAGALDVARTWRDAQPGDVLAWIGLGEALEASGDKLGAARAYGSIIDLFGARAEYRRFAGERLERTGERALAVDTYRRAVVDRPDQLTGHRLLAYALLRGGDHAGAFAAILAGVDQTSAAERYAGAPRVFARDAGMIAAAYIAAHLAAKDQVMAALRKRTLALVTQPSTRFILYWETDANDVDLHIRDKHGEEASFSQKTLASGGELFADVTTGFGPECFEVNGKLPAPPYELGVHYYAQGPMGYGMGLLQIERFDGRAFTFEDRPYVIMRDDARISLGKVR